MGKNINGDRPTAFPLEQEKLPFTIPVVEEPRPKIAKLVAMITDRVPAKLKGVKGNDPEYWGLADLISDEMADVALKMGVRKPKTIGQLMKLTKLEREPLQKLLDDMAWVGLIEYNWENLDGKNPNHEKRYVLPQFVPGSAEFFNMRRRASPGGGLLRADDLPAPGKDHPHGASRRRRHRHARDPRGKGHRNGERGRGPGEDLLLAAQVRGQVRQEHI